MLQRFALVVAALLYVGCSDDDGLAGPTTGLPTPESPVPPISPNPIDSVTNRAPIAVPDTFRIAPGQTIVITTLLANDGDPDGDPLVAYPGGIGGLTFNAATGHVEYDGSIELWQDRWPAQGAAFAWNPSGGFTFTAFPNATPGIVEVIYRAHEDSPTLAVSAPTAVVIIVE